MASDTVPGGTEETGTLRTDEPVTPLEVKLEGVEDRLLSLTEKISLCTAVLNDLKDLSDVLVRESLQDVPLPPQK